MLCVCVCCAAKGSISPYSALSRDQGLPFLPQNLHLQQTAPCQQHELYAYKHFTASGCIQRHLLIPSFRLSFIPGSVSFSLPCSSASPAASPRLWDWRGLFPPSLAAGGIWEGREGRTNSPDTGRRCMPRYFISTDRAVLFHAVTVLYLFPISSRTLRLMLHFISRSNRSQRRGGRREH